MAGVEASLPEAAEALAVGDLSKTYGGLRAVDGVSFEIGRGSISAVIGPNGAGKTTLFNMLTGVVRPDTGWVRLNGADVTGWPSHRLARAGMARTFQNIRLFPNLTILENVLVGGLSGAHATLVESVLFLPRHWKERRERMRRAEDLLHDCGLHERRFAYPRELPYGGQRRAEIARVLATDPDVLMLDEPCAGMNHREASEVVDLMVELNRAGKTIFLIEHNMRLVMSLAQMIFVFNFGTQIASGTPAEVQANDLVLEAYLGASR